jgi:competence protein ComGC
MQEGPTAAFVPLISKGQHTCAGREIVVLLSIMIFGILGCSDGQQLRNEASLRESLFVLRSEVRQFEEDHQRPPISLSELVSGGYIKQIPVDPFTRRNDTWRTEESAEHFDVHSDSDAISSEGTRYSWW